MGILLDRNNVAYIAQTKIGLAFLTLLLSRSQIIFNGEVVAEQEQMEWRGTFDKFFAEMEGHWGGVFPPAQAWGDDVYVWQFLASVAVGANMEQQHVLVQECRCVSLLFFLVCFVDGVVGRGFWIMLLRRRDCRPRLRRAKLIIQICF